MLIKKASLFVLCFWSVSFFGQNTIKAMFYNILNYNSDTESQNRTPHLKTILETVQPDLFMVCELKNETASDYLYTNAILPFKQSFEKAPFKYSESPATNLLQMVYYNSAKLELEQTSVIPTRIRDINHYTFKVKVESGNSNPVRIEVFVTHLKASRGQDNREKRNASATTFTRELDRLPTNSYVLFAGDFNFYTSNESGFQTIINSSNPIKIIDPVNRLCPAFPDDNRDYFNDDYDSTYFWNNSSFADVHSQSTRSSSLSDGSGGGMDDRFDFILISENLTKNNNLYYKPESYKTIGNNGNCYNSFVSNTTCLGEFSQNLRNALYQFSDHLPITLDLQVANTLSIYNTASIKFLNSNIVKDYLSIQVSDINLKSITIYNHLGQKVKSIEINNQKEISINLTSFSKGVYYLTADSLQPKKIIKI